MPQRVCAKRPCCAQRRVHNDLPALLGCSALPRDHQQQQEQQQQPQQPRSTAASEHLTPSQSALSASRGCCCATQRGSLRQSAQRCSADAHLLIQRPDCSRRQACTSGCTCRLHWLSSSSSSSGTGSGRNSSGSSIDAARYWHQQQQ
jgi:hypothetical protein